jgi:hypothetical protein
VTRTIPAAEVSAALLAASVAGVRAGKGVVRGVLVSDLFVCMMVASLTWMRGVLLRPADSL